MQIKNFINVETKNPIKAIPANFKPLFYLDNYKLARQ